MSIAFIIVFTMFMLTLSFALHTITGNMSNWTILFKLVIAVLFLYLEIRYMLGEIKENQLDKSEKME